jgi:uncharacterized protein YutE (UPF0331/DUF86 family)
MDEHRISGAGSMNVDTLRIKEKFAFAEKYVELARKLTNDDKEDFLESLELQVQGERVFEIISQVFLDVCTHIISRSKKSSPPRSYADCLYNLAEIGVFSREDAEKYAEMARMRNFISHNYDTIEREKLWDGLIEIITDFEKYRESVFSWLDSFNNQDK